MAACLQSKGDIITDLHENMAAEQNSRTTYDNILPGSNLAFKIKNGII